MVLAVLKDFSMMRFSEYAQKWPDTIRIVLGHRCSVLLLLLVVIQAEGAI